MVNFLLIFFGKLFLKLSKLLNLGSGSTWPGHIALHINPNFIKQTVSPKTKIILIAGTNGKTTTSAFISHILNCANFKVARNNSGANLLNGVASTIIENSRLGSKLASDYLVLEIDENSLPITVQNITPNYIIALNLFRDQLDRYGEIDSIVKKWRNAFEKINLSTKFILNADDPQIAFLGDKLKNQIFYFGLNIENKNQITHGADSIYCPNCFTKLIYASVYFSHLGNWKCPKCNFSKPTVNLSSLPYYPLAGEYNKYNFLAGVLFAKNENIKNSVIDEALQSFEPAFGRQEELESEGKKIKIFLSKNPISFNESLSTIKDLNANNILIVLNDRIPDGRDVSWIWDTDLFPLSKIKNITVSGDRAYDLGLRLKYEDLKFETWERLEDAIKKALAYTDPHQTLYILPTYSAMLEVRKIIGGRKIL